MTAKEEIAELLKQIPDDLTVDEALTRIRSAHRSKDSVGKEFEGHEEAEDKKPAPHDHVPPPPDGKEIKKGIIEIMERQPDDLTAAETICEAADDLRLFFLIQKDFEAIREGRMPPFDERDDEPVFEGEVPEIGPIPADDFERMSMKEKLVHTMNRLPEDLTLGQALNEALERMLLMYKLGRALGQAHRSETYTTEEVRRRMQELRK